jgi:hypothetical protein
MCCRLTRRIGYVLRSRGAFLSTIVAVFVRATLVSCARDTLTHAVFSVLPHRHIGIRIKGALIAAIYNKALSVDLTASKEGVGKLNNLMSVDVSVSAAVIYCGCVCFLELSRKTGQAHSACRCVSLVVCGS